MPTWQPERWLPTPLIYSQPAAQTPSLYIHQACTLPSLDPPPPKAVISGLMQRVHVYLP